MCFPSNLDSVNKKMDISELKITDVLFETGCVLNLCGGTTAVSVTVAQHLETQTLQANLPVKVLVLNRRYEVLRQDGTPHPAGYFLFARRYPTASTQWSQPDRKTGLAFQDLSSGGLSILELHTDTYCATNMKEVFRLTIKKLTETLPQRSLLVLDVGCANILRCVDAFDALVDAAHCTCSTVVVTTDSLTYCAFSPFGRHLLDKADATFFLTQSFRKLPRTMNSLRIPECFTPEVLSRAVINMDENYTTGLLMYDQACQIRSFPIDGSSVR